MRIVTEKRNEMFPGRPDYVGPKSGWFSLLHHASLLVEWSDDVMERIEYIKKHKPPHEQTTRLQHIVYLGERGATYNAKRAPLDAVYKAMRAPLDDEIIDNIRPLIPDFAWNGKELIFVEGK